MASGSRSTRSATGASSAGSRPKRSGATATITSRRENTFLADSAPSPESTAAASLEQLLIRQGTLADVVALVVAPGALDRGRAGRGVGSRPR